MLKKLKFAGKLAAVLLLVVLLLAAGCSALVGLMFGDVNINRANSLHLYTLIFVAAGVDWLARLCRRVQRLKWLPPLVAAAYACCFLLFTGVYFTGYNHQISEVFRSGVGELRRRGAR